MPSSMPSVCHLVCHGTLDRVGRFHTIKNKNSLITITCKQKIRLQKIYLDCLLEDTASARTSTHTTSNRFKTRFSHREAGFSLSHVVALHSKTPQLFVGIFVGTSTRAKIRYQQSGLAGPHGTDRYVHQKHQAQRQSSWRQAQRWRWAVSARQSSWQVLAVGLSL